MYSENLKSDNPGGAISDHYESLKIDGTGFDVKAGVIFRPVNDSPFRIGALLEFASILRPDHEWCFQTGNGGCKEI